MATADDSTHQWSETRER